MSISISVGTRDPAFATSLGRVHLAAQDESWLKEYLDTIELPATAQDDRGRPEAAGELARIRRQGFAIVDQELEEGLRAVAVPIHDRDGGVIAAVNVAMHTSGWTVAAIRRSSFRACSQRRRRSSATSPPFRLAESLRPPADRSHWTGPMSQPLTTPRWATGRRNSSSRCSAGSPRSVSSTPATPH